MYCKISQMFPATGIFVIMPSRTIFFLERMFMVDSGRVPLRWSLATAPVAHVLALHVVELLVDRIERQQFLVRTVLDDLAVFHHQDAVRVSDSREPVGNDEQRP